jgi:hypothetical protein
MQSNVGEQRQHAISDLSLSVVSASSKRTTPVAHHTGSGDYAFVARRGRLEEDLAYTLVASELTARILSILERH